ncbi:MAG TPA: HYR domain-containing protein [Methylomirabilota bacterium]|nr:HYR domain-containing protein [Methylomirabilota bacterium]
MKAKSVLLAKTAGVFAVLSTFIFSSNQASAACSLTPEIATNAVGQVHSVTAHITTNGAPVEGVLVSFTITSGPNEGLNQSSSTAADGNTVLTYTGTGGVGTDIIRATGTVNGVVFTCLATQAWTAVVIPPPTITCPSNIVTNAAAGECARAVAFTVIASGETMPTIRHRIGETSITSPHTFPAGTTTVTSTASNANGTATCSFVVTVTEPEPPAITCPADVFATVPAGEPGGVVDFEMPLATDNCGEVTLVCDPPSGSVFPVGTTPVVCTATDSSGNTNSCTFAVMVTEGVPDTHDMAVVKIKAPKRVTLKGGFPATKRVVVTIQNRSPHLETIFDLVQLDQLVTLSVQSLDTNLCSDIAANLVQTTPQRRLPFNLKPKRTMNVYYDVTFECAVNPGKGTGQEDFRYVAIVNHAAFDGVPDTHPECDVCPRLPQGVDPNPNGRIKDKGCGAPIGNGLFGNEVLTDVSVR